jgi:hypothetical protein
MNGNHAIIEVKSSQTSARGIAKDLETLALFRSTVGYERAIYLIYGDKCEPTSGRIVNVAKQMGGITPIELWLHSDVGEAAQQAATI